jgi:hypothetical protein
VEGKEKDVEVDSDDDDAATLIMVLKFGNYGEMRIYFARCRTSITCHSGYPTEKHMLHAVS